MEAGPAAIGHEYASVSCIMIGWGKFSRCLLETGQAFGDAGWEGGGSFASLVRGGIVLTPSRVREVLDERGRQRQRGEGKVRKKSKKNCSTQRVGADHLRLGACRHSSGKEGKRKKGGVDVPKGVYRQ